jgi:hypothetical protein
MNLALSIRFISSTYSVARTRHGEYDLMQYATSVVVGLCWLSLNWSASCTVLMAASALSLSLSLSSVHHPGSKRFRFVIDSYSNKYSQCTTKYEKMQVS